MIGGINQPGKSKEKEKLKTSEEMNFMEGRDEGDG